MLELNIDKLQVLALILEVVGITITILHVFRHKFSEQFMSKVDRFVVWSGIDVLDWGHGPEKGDYGESLVKSLTNIIGFILAFIIINYGDGFLWLILEFLSAAILGFLIGVILHLIMLSIFSAFIGWLKISGKGDLVAGIGVSLSCMGIFIEFIQVWYGPYRTPVFVAAGIVLFFLLIVAIFRGYLLEN